uniref:RNA-directed DNA polymerase n=1 Tax=Trichogramma kaykai TaxID=54128 RepID=A0ABD2WS82_9HYME
MLDAGATHTSMSRYGLEVAERCAARVIPAYNAVAKTFSGKPESILGRAEMIIEIGGVRHTMLVTIVESLECACLLGVDFYRIFNAIVYPREAMLTIDGSDEKIALEVASPSATSVCATATGLANLDEQQASQLNELLDRAIPKADGPLGCTNLTKHRIIVDSAKPIRQRYYSVSPKIEEEMHSQVRGMLADGIIRRSDSQWSSPVVMVRKANGKYRFCVDYRKLNACTKVSAYPLHNMDAILRKLRDARYITTLDMSAGYHQVPLHEDSYEYTAFTVPGLGLYEWLRMPFGISGGPATFQELMDRVIGPDLEPFAFSYLDDIIMVSSTFTEHLEKLELVLKRIADANLTINREKSFFCQASVKFLGVIVDREGIRPDPDKTAPMANFPAPKTLKQLRRFLGMASWYRKFLENFATIAEPLTRLTRKGEKFTWAEDQQNSFEKIRGMLATAPVLNQPSFEHEFVIQTDASDTGLGAVLTQTIDNTERVLCFASRTMNAAERNYSVTERECLAVLWAVQKFRPYVEGYHFKVISDHSSLKWLHNLKNPTGRLARWALELQQYDYEILHRKGSQNVVADALSRLHEEDEESCEIASLSIDDEKDAWYRKLFAGVQREPQKFPWHKIVGNRLYHYRPDASIEDLIEDQDAWKLLVPKHKRREILRENHEEPTAGHFGRHKTYERITLRYHWPSLHRDVTRYVKACQICQQCKVQQLLPAGLMGRRPFTKPWSVVAGDVMRPFPRTARGNEYILVFVDEFTRWVEVIPIRKANAQTRIIAYTEERHNTWDVHLPELTFAYNTATQESTKMSPAFLNMGRHPRPGNTVRQQEDEAAAEDDEAEQINHWRNRMNRMKEIHELAARNSRNAQERQAKYYDARHRDVVYHVGDQVWRKNRILSSSSGGIVSKMAPPFTGPYVVSKVLGSNVYEISDEQGNVVSMTNSPLRSSKRILLRSKRITELQNRKSRQGNANNASS